MTKTVLITGAGGGIGRVTCLEFARRGWRVAVCDYNRDAAEDTVAALRAEGAEAQAWHTDVGDSTQVQQLIAGVRERWGRLDAAFNNAGQSGARTPLADVDEADWDRVLRTSLTGTFLCMKYEIRAMLEQGGGCIVNNSSVFGIGGSASALYTAAKHGVSGLTKSAAISYAGNDIRVNAVCPGIIDAGMGKRYIERVDAELLQKTVAMHPAGRVGTAEEVAHAVVWLCSDEARYIHGQLLAVDGGYGARG